MTHSPVPKYPASPRKILSISLKAASRLKKSDFEELIRDEMRLGIWYDTDEQCVAPEQARDYRVRIPSGLLPLDFLISFKLLLSSLMSFLKFSETLLSSMDKDSIVSPRRTSSARFFLCAYSSFVDKTPGPPYTTIIFQQLEF